MSVQKIYHHVPGSERTPSAKSRIVGEVDPKGLLTITVRLRRPAAGSELRTQSLELSRRAPHERKYLTRTEFKAQHGADAADLAKIEAFAYEHGLTVAESSRAKRSVKLSGTVEALTGAFKVELHQYSRPDLNYRGRTGSISVPEDLAEIVVGVHGFDNQPVAQPHYRHPGKSKVTAAAESTNANDGSFSALDLARLYNFPPALDGTGQCIALIELNDLNRSTNQVTGAGFKASDLQTFFSNLNLPTPQVVVQSIDGARTSPDQIQTPTWK